MLIFLGLCTLESSLMPFTLTFANQACQVTSFSLTPALLFSLVLPRKRGEDSKNNYYL